MKPDLQLFLEHIQDAPFLLGVDEDRWGIHDEENIEDNWPYIILWIKAPKKKGCPEKYYFRFDLSGYSSQAPTACPWEIEENKKLDSSKWPKGSKLVSSVFNPGWNNGDALYCPCDRKALKGHDRWKNQYPELWWRSDDTIVKYLTFVHGILNSGDYVRA